MNFEEILSKLKDGKLCGVRHPETKRWQYYKFIKGELAGFSDQECSKPIFGMPFFYAPLITQDTW